jgi:putative (di)nucleoside polyphosphate hydrolase
MFRANVGVVVLDSVGNVLAFERAAQDPAQSTGQWQLPQGGVDAGEEPEQAWSRELEEETGLGRSEVTLLDEYPEWLVYELPSEARHQGHVRGQAQKWFIVRLHPDAKPDPVAAAERRDERAEFRAYKWTTMSALALEVWPVKRAIYLALAEYLRVRGYA